MSPRPLFLHVGCRKTGTSSLQTALKRSRSGLLLDGLCVPLRGRPGHLKSVLRPLQDLSSGEEKSGHEGMRELVDGLRRAPGERVLLSLEDLAELPERSAAYLVEALRPHFEVHVVITARDWAGQIPSEWQQVVKSRGTISFPDFAQAVRDAAPAAEQFWRNQHVPGIARRWGGSLPPGQVHVIAVPPARREPTGIYQHFADLTGFDASRLQIDREIANVSMGYEQAEVLRRVNVALGERLGDVRSQYRPAVRALIINRGLRTQEGQKVALPTEHSDWCRDVSEAMVAEIRTAGYDLRGDPDDLLPPPGSSGQHVETSEERLAAVAVQALAAAACVNYDNIVRHEAAMAASAAERERLRRRLKARRHAGSPPTTTPSRRVVRRIGSAVRQLFPRSARGVGRDGATHRLSRPGPGG